MNLPDQIPSRLNQLVQERNLQLLYACESGSRAWGMASTDSDYDVRFVYQHEREWYLTLQQRKDQIGPLMEQEGVQEGYRMHFPSVVEAYFDLLYAKLLAQSRQLVRREVDWNPINDFFRKAIGY